MRKARPYTPAVTGYGISLRQPQPDDLLGTTVSIAALGTAFEASYEWKLLNGAEVLAQGYFQAGRMGVTSAFLHEATLDKVTYMGPAIFQFAGDDPSGGKEGVVTPIRVPVVVVPGSSGYLVYQVVKGDTLSKIVREHSWSGVATIQSIAVANNLADPDKINIGQLLRIPV
jgi:nucleoid-associated protein YgaU